MTAAAKLCINCKHYIPHTSDDAAKRAEFSRCRACPKEDNSGLVMVDGRELVVTYSFCDNARRYESVGCGPDAKLFEASEAEAA